MEGHVREAAVQGPALQRHHDCFFSYLLSDSNMQLCFVICQVAEEGVCQGLPSSRPTGCIYLQQTLQKGHNNLQLILAGDVFLQRRPAGWYFTASCTIFFLQSKEKNDGRQALLCACQVNATKNRNHSMT